MPDSSGSLQHCQSAYVTFSLNVHSHFTTAFFFFLKQKSADQILMSSPLTPLPFQMPSTRCSVISSADLSSCPRRFAA